MANANEPMVSVIIINYNGEKFLKKCFSSLGDMTYRNFEVILADNASSDNSLKFTEENYPSVRIAAFDKNYGFAEGNNKAVEIARGEYIAFLNNDTYVDRNWLTELMKVAISDENIGICTSKIYLAGQGRLLNSCGGNINLIGQAWDEGYLEEDYDQYNQIKEVMFPCGAAFLIKKNVGEQVGFFDKSHFAYYEDVDIGWKTWLFGYKVVYIPNAIIFHEYKGTFRSVKISFVDYIAERNRLMTFARNFSNETLLKLAPLLILNEFTRTIGYIIMYKNPMYLFQRLKIYASIFIKLPYIMRKRDYIQSSRKIDDRQILRFFKDFVPRFSLLKDNKATIPIRFLNGVMKSYKKKLV